MTTFAGTGGPRFSLDLDLVPGVAFGADRFVLWRARESPVGPASALGRIGADGRLVLHSAAPAFADLLRVWHKVHAVRRSALRVRETDGALGRKLRIQAEPEDAASIDLTLDLEETLATRAISAALAWTLPCVRESRALVRAQALIAGPLLGTGEGRRFEGPTETGVRVLFAARRVTGVAGGAASIAGAPQGAPRPIDDPPDWGALRMPRAPLFLSGTLVVSAPCPDLSRARQEEPACAPA